VNKGRHLSDGLLAALVAAVLAARLVMVVSSRPAYAALAMSGVVVVAMLGVGFRRRRTADSSRRRKAGLPASGFATRRQLGALLVRRPTGDRIVLGKLGGSQIAAERLQSVLVVGPSQSGKTRSLALPAIVEWDGPVLATSVKSDLVSETLSRRAALGEVAVFDPTGCSRGVPAAGWSPLTGATSWSSARRTADSLCSLGRRDGGMEDAGFWYSCAERLIAPLLLAACLRGGSMAMVVRWLEEEDMAEPMLTLESLGQEEAARTAHSTDCMEERQRSSVFSTARSVLDAYADPAVAASEQLTPLLSGAWLLGGNTRSLYCCAPAREQQRLSPVFVALVREVLDAAFEAASLGETPLEPPLLVVLDEAANVAPLPDLDTILATAAGHGVQLLTVWQDLAQVEARYGPRWATVVNNHRAKVICPGVADPRTLEIVSTLAGEAETLQRSRSKAFDGSVTETETASLLPAAPAGWIRRLPEQHLLIVYGRLPPAVVLMRPFERSRAAPTGRRPRP
jgi:type IV secretion system protein VirD4